MGEALTQGRDVMADSGAGNAPSDAATPGAEPALGETQPAGEQSVGQSVEAQEWLPGKAARVGVLLVLAGVGVAYLLTALRLPVGSLQRPDYGFFPVVIGLMFVTSSAVVLLRWLAATHAARGGQEQAVDRGGSVRRFPWRLGVIIVALLSYVFIAEVVGHTVSAMVVAALVLRMAGARSWWKILVLAAGIGIGSYLVFSVLLGMSLPSGVVGLDV